jgi:hypothetical protein
MTTINEPTDAIRDFRGTQVFDSLIVVGDRKTPADWHHDGVEFLGSESHEIIAPRLSEVLPWNHYSRKMIGYLHAISKGSKAIYETDDDNVPANWFSNPINLASQFGNRLTADQGFINIYKLFHAGPIWPRGLPLNMISHPKDISEEEKTSPLTDVGIFQGLADGSPDVDAIYRLLGFSEEIVFERRPPVALDKGTYAPLNSQNTWFAEFSFPLMYLPTTVTFRYTDILRGLVAQPIMWHFGYRVAFTEATVTQERNPHNLMEDFRDEIPMYLHGELPVALARDSAQKSATVSEALHRTYDSLYRHEIVTQDEIICLDRWLEEIGNKL